MKLPPDRGFSVNLETRTVHTRYPGDHAGEVRRARTAGAVESLLDGRRGKVCRTCYPAPIRSTPSVHAPDNGQVRRVAPTESE